MEEASRDHLSSNPYDTLSQGLGWKADWNSIREAFNTSSTPLFALQIVRISKQIKKRSVPKVL